jgi:hypothetical protein
MGGITVTPLDLESMATEDGPLPIATPAVTDEPAVEVVASTEVE